MTQGHLLDTQKGDKNDISNGKISHAPLGRKRCRGFIQVRK